MKNIAAYLLLGLGGATEPTKDDITRVIEAGGGAADGYACFFPAMVSHWAQATSSCLQSALRRAMAETFQLLHCETSLVLSVPLGLLYSAAFHCFAEPSEGP